MLMLEMSQDIFPRPTHFSWWNLQAMHSCFTRCHSSQPYANFMSRILQDINCHGIFSCCRLMITWWHKDLDSLLSSPDCRLRTGWLTLLPFVVEARSSLPSWPPPPSPAPGKLYRRARIFWVWSKPSEDWRIRSPSSFSLSCPSQWNRSLVHAMRRERTQSSCGKRKKRKKEGGWIPSKPQTSFMAFPLALSSCRSNLNTVFCKLSTHHEKQDDNFRVHIRVQRCANHQQMAGAQVWE